MTCRHFRRFIRCLPPKEIDPGAGVTGLSAVNVATANGGRPGDVLLGTFRQLPGMTAEEAAGVLPDKDGAVAFMVVNALIVANTNPLVTDTSSDYAPHTATGGNGADTEQEITVTVDPSKVDPSVRPGRAAGPGRDVGLFRVERSTGEPIKVALSAAPGGGHQFTVRIRGSEGELYFWA